MTTMELSARKLEFVEKTIPGVPRTVEELKASVARAEEQYEKGLFLPQEEVFGKYEKWL